MNNTILILGGDGYLGWPLSMKLALQYPDHKIVIVDNQWRKDTVTDMGFAPLFVIPPLSGRVSAFQSCYGISNLHYHIFDICSSELDGLIERERPQTIYHLAQQCSAPYSMMGPDEALYTLRNNEEGNMRLLWAAHRYTPLTHIVKLGSFGEYAKSSIPIAEGYFRPSYKGIAAAADLPYPRAANDIYHISKINDSNYLGMAARIWNLRITEVMQSTVFGVLTPEMISSPDLYTRFDYDPVFGTVANRFVTQAVSGTPLTIYGSGHQRTGLMALPDAVSSLARFVSEPVNPGEHRVVNHVTETHYSINELAEDIAAIALEAGHIARLEHLDDLRKENAAAKAVYETESSLYEKKCFHSDFRLVIRETIDVLHSCRKQLSGDYFLPSVSWADGDHPVKKVVAGQTGDPAGEDHWQSIRKEHFDSTQLNLNPGCLGTLAVTNGGGFKSNQLRGNPLALYAASREAYRQICKECRLLWPSPGYRLSVTYSTSQTMNLLALAMLRKLQEVGAGPFCVVTSKHEHPGGIGPFERIPEYRIRYLDDEVLEDPHLLELELQVMQPAIVLLSHTYYYSGVVAQDVHTLKVIKEAVPYAWLILDAAQSLGIHPLPFGAADLVTGSTHKWLFGPYGGGLTWIKHTFAEWLGALFWNGQQLFQEEDTHGFSLPGGQDFQLYTQLQHSLELHNRTGPETILTRSCELACLLSRGLSELFAAAGIGHYFINDEPSPCLALAFPDYDPYPLYRHLHEAGIHIKCINQRQLNNGSIVNILRIGIPYYESRERLGRLLSEIGAFLSVAAPLPSEARFTTLIQSL